MQTQPSTATLNTRTLQVLPSTLLQASQQRQLKDVTATRKLTTITPKRTPFTTATTILSAPL